MSVVNRQPDPSGQQSAVLVSLGVFIVLGGAMTVQTGLQGGRISIVAWVSGPITLVLVGAFVWVWARWRRGLRVRSLRLAAEQAQHPVGTARLPLTHEVSTYLQQEADGAAHPVRTTLGILGMFAVIPTFMTVLFAIRGVAFDIFPVVMWAGFLGLGAVVSVGVLHDLRQERRDLIGGVFNRATGTFSIRLIQNRYGTMVAVVVGGRSLKSVAAPMLEGIESVTGTVDYLPVSGDLLEVRDDSGQALWRRFAEAPNATVQSSVG